MAIHMLQNNREIKRVSRLSLEEFNSEYLKKGVPVIIEQGIEHWQARQWTLDTLKEKAGDNKVMCRWNTSCEEYKLGQKYNIRETTFGEYISDLKKGNKRSQKSYLAVQNIRKALPQLEADIEVPEYIGKLHGGPYLWIAHKGHYEYCHFDPDDGMLIILNGHKRVRLFHCDISPLYPNTLGSKGRTIQSTVDCDNPDFNTHPLFKDATCHYGDVNNGDMLYIPAFWWHQVTSIEQTISVNIFWGDAGKNVFLTKSMEMPRWQAFSHWLLNVVEQNRSYANFNRILTRLPESIYHFLKNQWHEEATEEQLDRLKTLVMEYLNITELPNEQSTGNIPPLLQIRGLLWRS